MAYVDAVSVWAGYDRVEPRRVAGFPGVDVGLTTLCDGSYAAMLVGATRDEELLLRLELPGVERWFAGPSPDFMYPI